MVPVTVFKLRTRHDSYASFKVACNQEPHYHALLDADAWDAGALVRPFVPATERPSPPSTPHPGAAALVNERSHVPDASVIINCDK